MYLVILALELLEQFEPNYVHTLRTTHKGNCRHNETLAQIGAELIRGEKYFKTLERLGQFEPNYVHILPIASKGNCRHKVILAPLEAEL